MENKHRIQLMYRSSLVSGVFCVVVSLLLLLNYLQFSSKEPLESRAMEIMLERLSDDPNNEQLKEDIRDLDLLARKAYFNSQWQIRTGSYLLLFGAIVFAVSLRYYHSLRKRIEEPEEDRREVFRGGILTQRWILGTASLLMIAAVATSFITANHLEKYGSISNLSSGGEDAQDDPGIEVIDLSAEESDGLSKSGESLQTDDTGQPGETGHPDGTSQTGQAAGSAQDDPSAAAAAAAENAGSAESGEPHAATGTQAAEGPAGPASTPPAGSSAAANLTPAALQSQYNSFRGPWGQGVSNHKGIPVNWDGGAGSSVIWKTELLKPGYNSPVIWGDRLFLTGADEESLVVYCYDRNTGQLLWQAETGEIPGSPARKPDVTEDTGLAAPGMATDGIRVYAIFATGDVVCFTMGGHRLWARNLGVPDNHYGHSSSLLVWDAKLFIQFDSNRGGRLLALNVITGETVWDVRRNAAISWASPILVEHNGKMQIVLTADPIVAGYDINTGEEIWSNECMMGEVGPSPGYWNGKVYAANEYARLVAIGLDNPGEYVWEDDEYLPEVASPVASNGLLYIATSYGVFLCYDAETGEKYWEKEYGHGFYSSPVIADGKVYALDMGGMMHIFNLTKDFSLAGESPLGERAYTTPAFAGGRIYIRGEKHLYCIGE